ncbi:efflux RND transporter periplasmic adaptor subunit [Planctomycetota bacterium]
MVEKSTFLSVRNCSTQSRTAQVPAGSLKKRRSTYLLFFVGLMVVALVIVAVTRWGVKSQTVTGGTFAALRGDLTITVTEGGSIRARNAIQYACEVERRGGELSILSIVPAGTYVTQEDVDNGKVLVELDASALKERLVRVKLDLATEQEGLTSAKETYEIQLLQNESDISDGQLKLRFALRTLQKYLGVELATLLTADANAVSDLTEHMAPVLERIRNDPNQLTGSAAWQELKRFNDEIVIARGNLTTAQATLTGTEELHDANYVSDLELDRDRLAVTNRQFALDNALINLDLFLQFDFPQMVEQYVSDYIEAWRQLQRIHAQCRSRTASAQGRLSDAHEQVAEEEQTLAWILRLIDKCTIRAKAPGLVIYGTGTGGEAYSAMRGRSGSGGSGIIAPGENVYQGQVLISMPDMVSMIAEINVHETEVDKVRPGQTAQIVMEAFSERFLRGRVLEVAPLPDEQQSMLNPDLKVYKTLVSIDGTHDYLRSRMSCKVVIYVQQLKDVVLVPIQVVSNRRGRKVVYLRNARGDAEERPVTTGAFNETFVQITEGLQEGDEVLLNPPLFSDTGGPVTFGPARQPMPEDPNAGDHRP